MGEDKTSTSVRSKPFSDSSGPLAELLQSLAVGNGPFPDRPAGMLLANLGGRSAADVAVVPLLQFRIDYGSIAEACNFAGSAGPQKGTAEDEIELASVEQFLNFERFFFSVLRQWQVVASGVLTCNGPFGLAVAYEPDGGRCVLWVHYVESNLAKLNLDDS